MNFENYAVKHYEGGFEVYHKESGEVLLYTERVSLDTLVRVAVVDDARRHNIRLGRLSND